MSADGGSCIERREFDVYPFGFRKPALELSDEEYEERNDEERRWESNQNVPLFSSEDTRWIDRVLKRRI